MFYFGDPEETAQIYWEKAVAMSGPRFADVPADEMTPKSLRAALVYARCAYSFAEIDLQPQPVLDVLMAQYDELFEIMAMVDDTLKEAIKTKKHKYLGGYSKENISKYKELVGLGRNPKPALR